VAGRIGGLGLDEDRHGRGRRDIMGGGSGGGGNGGRTGGGGGGGDAVISNIDTKIEALNQKIDSHSENRARLNYESNPAFDTGGIRGKSAKAKEQNFNSMINHAKNAVELTKERNTLITTKKNYESFQKTVKATDAMIARGTKKDGTPYTKAELKDLKSLSKEYSGYVSGIRQRHG